MIPRLPAAPRRWAGLLLLLVTPLLGQEKTTTQASLVGAARSQVGKTVIYDGSYKSLTYPGGDVPLERGVCTDVVIRALRSGLKLDLQVLVHEDMKAHFTKYPKIWGLKRPDKNIDHRRVPNLQTYFKRRGWARQVTKKAEHYQPGDLVTCTVPPNLPHIMVVSDRRTEGGVPLVLHNIGAGTQEEDCLFRYPLTGHYRLNIPATGESKGG